MVGGVMGWNHGRHCRGQNEWVIRTIGQLAVALGGSVSGGSVDVAIDRIVIDSRSGRRGDGFLAVRAERDGHHFVTAAREAGALVAIVDHLIDDKPSIVVDDTIVALARGGTAARAELIGDVIGMTGSVGKTTTKDLAAAILGRSRRVTASERSLNNELGVPLTLLNAVEGTEVSVIELGARGIGHVAELCEIAAPTIGVVTVVAPAHLELFGSLEAIVEAKGELIEALPPSGTAVLNADSAEVMSMAGRTSARVLTFGEAGEVRLTDVELDRRLVVSAVVHTPWGSAPVRLGVSGRNQIVNAAAAAAAAIDSGFAL
jgi:UDP-N-acetylmuramoyl-tripeptide--D-alanyl-D-alanine ligase